jgi:tRNA pseudouridine32 synthase/23S rRNA pseudouridine746 synthase
MVVARSSEAASSLSQAWRERDQVRKTYLARVNDWPPFQGQGKPDHGVINLPLAPCDNEKIKWKVSDEGKPSTTLWRVVSSNSEHVTLELKPVTGRTHQLRIHCAAVSSSGIVGDKWYGKEANKGSTTSSPAGESRLYLHAYKLSFPHPRTKKKMEFAVDPDW